MPRNLTNHVCEWDGCTVRTVSRLDGVTPLKYCKGPGTPNHKAAAQQRWNDRKEAEALERANRDATYRTILEQAMRAGVDAVDATPPGAFATTVSKTIVFQANRKFSNFLVREHLATVTPEGVVIHFPPTPGTAEQAQAVFETLAPLTATGQPLEGQRITVR
jgi:hypothetical protein